MIIIPNECKKIIKQIKFSQEKVQWVYRKKERILTIQSKDSSFSLKEIDLSCEEDFCCSLDPALRSLKKCKMADGVRLEPLDSGYVLHIGGAQPKKISLEKQTPFPEKEKEELICEKAGTQSWIDRIKEAKEYVRNNSLYPDLAKIHFVGDSLQACNLTCRYIWRIGDEEMQLPHKQTDPLFLSNIELFKKSNFQIRFFSDSYCIENQTQCMTGLLQDSHVSLFEKEISFSDSEEIDCRFNMDKKTLLKEITTFVQENPMYNGKRFAIPMIFQEGAICFGKKQIGSTSFSQPVNISLKDSLLPIDEQYTWLFLPNEKPLCLAAIQAGKQNDLKVLLFPVADNV